MQQGTLALMIVKTPDVAGPLHGFGITRRVEQISREHLALNQETSYPLPIRLKQEGAIKPGRRPSENNRRARLYRLTRAGRKRLQAEPASRHQTADIITLFLAINAETSL